jgi:hypothetical protein
MILSRDDLDLSSSGKIIGDIIMKNEVNDSVDPTIHDLVATDFIVAMGLA